MLRAEIEFASNRNADARIEVVRVCRQTTDVENINIATVINIIVNATDRMRE